MKNAERERLVAAASALLDRHDPLGIAGEGLDECRPEARSIIRQLPRAGGERDALLSVRRVLLASFGACGAEERLAPPARQRWELWAGGAEAGARGCGRCR